MKKIIYISILAVMVLFTSCFKDAENWYSETSSYDGRYVVAQTCEEYSDDNTTIEDGEELMIYSSATNVENEIIIDCSIAGCDVKGKFNVTGNSSDFSTSDVVDNISRSDLESPDCYAIIDDKITDLSKLGTPDTMGLEASGIQFYARLSLEEGKVIQEGATTIGGNVSDSVYMKVKTYSDYIVIESYLLPEDDWTKPGVPEYDWKIKDGSRTNADGFEEHWTLAGYRYTGYPEDL